MSPVRRIAREEWRALSRDRVAMLGLLLLTVLTLVAALNAAEHRRTADAERGRYQSQANDEFANQPDRHPHRVAHFGHFVFRPLNPLAAFDPGIDAYTGHTLFLEAHRQNGANFGDVRQSSLLLRFGQLTPAFILQVLAPLLLVFVGHNCVTRERESGTLRVLLSQGLGSGQVVMGKLLALLGFAGLVLLPALLALLWLAASGQAAWAPVLVLACAYAAWLLLWSLLVTLASTVFRRGRDALLGLLATWTVLVILLPRGVSDLAGSVVAMPTRFENAIHVEREYQALGNAHRPDDPKFAEFRDRILEQYGVTSIEELPVNFKGLVGTEGERRSSELFNRYAAEVFDLQERQNHLVDQYGWLSPTLALRRLSMTVAGTDLASFRHFLEQGEQYRYDLVQRLNRLQSGEITYADDTDPDKENRISHAHWQAFPDFHYQPFPVDQALRRAAPAGAMLLAWLAALASLTWLLGGRLGRAVR
ncbi:ABC transporter permease [Parahaliea mediterranea]|uniref:DUF3526 domain-containing protein n=1 Tax=Parahaliea mediterranea TaxID=651086 RepID=A0A939DDD5_9GAMM|nr:DUF3526 domain-containing protein [Parahaliea mediterranea]MBN7796015.1 DUF3526 domain-containing protein [Parahaliea mediterranea]